MDRVTSIQQAAAALANYYSDNGSYPTPTVVGALAAGTSYTKAQFDTGALTDYIGLVNTLKTGGYIEKCSRDPQDGNTGCSLAQSPVQTNYGFRYFCWLRAGFTGCQDYALITPVEADNSASAPNLGTVYTRGVYMICDGQVTSKTSCGY